MISFRDETAKRLNAELIVHTNEAGKAAGVTPFTHGARYTDIMKTEALKQALDKYGCDAAIGGARRDEEKSRAKERVFSASAMRSIAGIRRTSVPSSGTSTTAACAGRQHPRVPAVELDRGRHLDLHPHREHPGGAAVLRQAAPDRRSRRAQDHGGRRSPAAEAGREAASRDRPLPFAGLLSADRRAGVEGRRAFPRSSKRCCAPRPRSARAAPSTRIPPRRWKIASAKVTSEWPPHLHEPWPRADPPTTRSARWNSSSRSSARSTCCASSPAAPSMTARAR